MAKIAIFTIEKLWSWKAYETFVIPNDDCCLDSNCYFFLQNACRAARDFTGCSLLKRYYAQIYSLYNRLVVFESQVGVQCVWADIYTGQTKILSLLAFCTTLALYMQNLELTTRDKQRKK